MLAACLLFAPTWLSAQIDAGPPLEILYGFTLIDGLGGPPIEDAAMAIRGNRILTISSRRELLTGPNAPRDAVAVDLGGGWVIPGLIDTHVHLATVPNRARAEAELYRLLYSGVTAVRDMAGDGRALASLARDSRLGEIEAPDVVFSALMAGPSFLSDPRPQSSAAGERAGEVPWMQAVTPETDLVTAVARAEGTYATGVKIYANLEAAQVRAITEEAHRQGMQVWAHSMVFPARPLEVVRSGVDVVSHVCRLAWEAMADAPDAYHHDRSPEFGTFSASSPVFTELLREMRNRGTILDATLSMYARSDSLRRANPDSGGGERCDTGFARSLVARAHELGVAITAGTDYTTPPEAPFPALYDEMEELVANGGLTPMAAIRSATSVAAEALGLGDTHGSLRHGRPVTFVLLAESPLDDITNLRSVRAVWKNAVRYDRDAFRPRTVAAAADGEPTAITRGYDSPRQVFEAWLALWRRYDLDRVPEIFLEDETLTYFPSDAEGVRQGLEAVVQHHRDVGFVRGGFQPEQELWVEDPLIADFGDSAVITGVWYFGNRVAREGAGHGPLTMVVVRTRNGYRISHLNLANYPRSAAQGS